MDNICWNMFNPVVKTHNKFMQIWREYSSKTGPKNEFAGEEIWKKFKNGASWNLEGANLQILEWEEKISERKSKNSILSYFLGPQKSQPCVKYYRFAQHTMMILISLMNSRKIK